MIKRHWIMLASLGASVAINACSSDPNEGLFSGGGDPQTGGSAGAAQGGSAGIAGSGTGGSVLPDAGYGGSAGGGGVAFDAGGGAAGQPIDAAPDAVDDCTAAAKLVYLVSQQGTLYSFNPDVDGPSAYVSIGPLACNSTATPQSMAVDRSANAYVFYSSGQLFRVSTTDASCALMNYTHPGTGSAFQLGMAFTAAAPNAYDQVLYVQSPDFGLATIDLSTFAVSKKNVLAGVASELTGGADGKLFQFAAATASLGEINLTDFTVAPMHTFSLTDVFAWAFARYGGLFYLFTASQSINLEFTKTTIWDPTSNTESLRDANLGFTVVGAGQSICARGAI